MSPSICSKPETRYFISHLHNFASNIFSQNTRVWSSFPLLVADNLLGPIDLIDNNYRVSQNSWFSPGAVYSANFTSSGLIPGDESGCFVT